MGRHNLATIVVVVAMESYHPSEPLVHELLPDDHVMRAKGCPLVRSK